MRHLRNSDLASPESAAQYEADNVAAFQALAQCPKPVVAMIHGPCIGGGLAIALTADIRYCDQEATFAIPAARLGLAYPPSEIETLVRTVGMAAAKEIFFTARRFTADEAVGRGLVSAVKRRGELYTFVRETADADRRECAPHAEELQARRGRAGQSRTIVATPPLFSGLCSSALRATTTPRESGRSSRSGSPTSGADRAAR